ncbi:hypothetical protein GLU01_00615 [Nanohaloarchaea archaeon]|nr:hypothetical protein [Candidatus Nanohaloarchaea archaeon]
MKTFRLVSDVGSSQHTVAAQLRNHMDGHKRLEVLVLHGEAERV